MSRCPRRLPAAPHLMSTVIYITVSGEAEKIMESRAVFSTSYLAQSRRASKVPTRISATGNTSSDEGVLTSARTRLFVL